MLSLGAFLVGARVALAGIVLSQLDQNSVSLASVSVLPPGMSRLVIAAGIALMIPFLASDRVNARLRPVHRPFLFLSAMSYSLYLFHRPLMLAFTAIVDPRFSYVASPSGALTTYHVEIFAGLIGV